MPEFPNNCHSGSVTPKMVRHKKNWRKDDHHVVKTRFCGLHSDILGQTLR